MPRSGSSASSPDPLALSFPPPFSSPSRPVNVQQSANAQRALTSPGKRDRGVASSTERFKSPTKQRRTFIFSTPTKPATKDFEPSTQSPWRIRVTVEADPIMDEGPARRTRASARRPVISADTTTSSVPLKGEENTPLKKKKTPVRKSTRQSKTPDAEESIAQPRRWSKRKADAVEDEPVPTSPVGGESEQGSSKMQKRTRGRPRKDRAPPGAEQGPSAAEGAKPRDFTALTPLHQRQKLVSMSTPLGGSAAQETSSVAKPRQRKSVSGRVATPRRPAGFDESALSPVPTSSPLGETGAEIVYSEPDDAEPEDETALLDKSMADSENFSIVTLGALKSEKAKAEQAARQINSRPTKIGFGQETMKELRAGYKKGEALALEEEIAASVPKRPIQYPALLTPAESSQNSPPEGSQHYDEMSWRPTTPQQSALASHRGEDAGAARVETRAAPPPPTTSREQALEPHLVEFAEQWQREREAVIQEASQADSSKVIQIDSDSLSGDEESAEDEQHEGPVATTEDVEMPDADEEGDIWQEEADRSFEESQNPPNAVADETTTNLDDLLGIDTRPTRARLPRTWRRESNNPFLYSDEVETPKKSLPAAHAVLAEPRPKSPVKSILSSPAKRQARSMSREGSPSKSVTFNAAPLFRPPSPSPPHPPALGNAAHSSSSPLSAAVEYSPENPAAPEADNASPDRTDETITSSEAQDSVTRANTVFNSTTKNMDRAIDNPAADSVSRQLDFTTASPSTGRPGAASRLAHQPPTTTTTTSPSPHPPRRTGMLALNPARRYPSLFSSPFSATPSHPAAASSSPAIPSVETSGSTSGKRKRALSEETEDEEAESHATNSPNTPPPTLARPTKLLKSNSSAALVPRRSWWSRLHASLLWLAHLPSSIPLFAPRPARPRPRATGTPLKPHLMPGWGDPQWLLLLRCLKKEIQLHDEHGSDRDMPAIDSDLRQRLGMHIHATLKGLRFRHVVDEQDLRVAQGFRNEAREKGLTVGGRTVFEYWDSLTLVCVVFALRGQLQAEAEGRSWN